jgi:integrase/recombinase XerD
MTVTAGACERWSSSCGAPGCASRKRSRSPSTISITGADRCWSAAARAGAAARSTWTSGGGSSYGRGWNARAELPVGPLFCIIDGPTRGRPWSGDAVRGGFRRLAVEAGVRRRFAPHQLRHAHALELAREGVALNIIQRQLGHANLGTTSIYLQGIDPEEIITAVRTRRAPMMSASAGLRL